jgi:hypothetical protein
MPNNSDIRFVHRVRPLSSIVGYVICALVLIGIVVWEGLKSDFWEISYLFIPGAFVFLLIAVFQRTRTFIVNDDGLTLIKRPIIGLFGSFDFFQRSSIRKIRYRAEKHYDIDTESDIIHYILELVTTDSQCILLLRVTRSSFDRSLGRRIAVALHTSYEERLEDEYGNPM